MTEHVLGLDDSCPSANGGIKLEDNIEVAIPDDNFCHGILMHNNVFFSDNDMEMMLQAFLER